MCLVLGRILGSRTISNAPELSSKILQWIFGGATVTANPVWLISLTSCIRCKTSRMLSEIALYSASVEDSATSHLCLFLHKFLFGLFQSRHHGDKFQLLLGFLFHTPLSSKVLYFWTAVFINSVFVIVAILPSSNCASWLAMYSSIRSQFTLCASRSVETGRTIL